uniref:Uncharacterized protein n=1 Tax=Myripristis murdjan TaxID=586833 RepID=A0A667XZZ0_9TELE
KGDFNGSVQGMRCKDRTEVIALKLLIVLFHAQVFTHTPPKPTSAFYAASLECASGRLDNNDFRRSVIIIPCLCLYQGFSRK